MKANNMLKLIALAALGWVILILFQAKWIYNSHQLIEEQFDQKVTMALCAAVSQTESTEEMACGYHMETADAQPLQFTLTKKSDRQSGKLLEKKFRTSMDEAMAFYDIHIPYEIGMANQSEAKCDITSPYCCKVEPFSQEDEGHVLVTFPGKQKYIFKQMAPMIISSIFILLFVLGIFLWTLRALIRQRKISQFNIDFFNNMAHEFNTPVTNIRLALKRLVAKNPSLAGDTYLQIIESEDEKLAAQVQGVLSLAKIENQENILEKKPVNISEILHQVVNDMHLQIQEQQANIKIDGSVQNIIVEGDAFHLSHAFKNILENAMKYCRQNPAIKISGRFDKDKYVLSFADNGIGISKSDRKIIFDKFQRVGNENTHDQKGFGLGLAYVQMILKQHNGYIDVKNNIPSGTRFELAFPTLSNQSI